MKLSQGLCSERKIGSCIKCWSIEGFTIEAPLPGSAADLTPAQILTGHCKLCVKSRMPYFKKNHQTFPTVDLDQIFLLF